MKSELTHCPACSHQVSPKASACPGCGHPIAAEAPEAGQTAVTTVQATSKHWKGLQMLGVTLVIIGLMGSCSTLTGNDPDKSQIAPFIFLAGLALYLYAKVNAWWHHG